MTSYNVKWRQTKQAKGYGTLGQTKDDLAVQLPPAKMAPLPERFEWMVVIRHDCPGDASMEPLQGNGLLELFSVLGEVLPGNGRLLLDAMAKGMTAAS